MGNWWRGICAAALGRSTAQSNDRVWSLDHGPTLSVAMPPAVPVAFSAREDFEGGLRGPTNRDYPCVADFTRADHCRRKRPGSFGSSEHMTIGAA